jgi:hypothetical protein
MANTYTLIQSYTLASDTANGVTFSSIPNTYTHLIINFSAKDTRADNVDDLRISINGNSGSYSNVRLYGANGGTGSDGGTGSNNTYFGFGTAANAPANLFGNGTMLFPNYTSNTTKNGTQNSGAVGYISGSTGYQIGLVSIASPVTAAITSITISGYNSVSNGTLSAGSTLFLYGLKST